ncbi:hypothetical protein K474DRAFT_397249 [Panus rudis PR-1116 ss-1]|nr:hypothetical protein K474DRAFT_397249 [Panus rudis PR-1116 ss-1]
MLTGITRKDSWPNWSEGMPERRNESTNVPYYTPHFDGGVNHVNHEVNRKLLKHISTVIWDEYTTKNSAPSFMRDKNLLMTQSVILSLCSVTFGGFKSQYNGQKTQERVEKMRGNAQNNRQAQRRKAKSKQLLAVAEAYMTDHGADPSYMVHDEWLSDEVSEDPRKYPQMPFPDFDKILGLRDAQKSRYFDQAFGRRPKNLGHMN